MSNRSLALAALIPLVIVGACNSDNNVIVPTGIARVRFVNATGSNITVANNGVVGPGNSSLAFGGSSSCLNVNTGSPNLVFTNSNTGATIGSFAPLFGGSGSFTVVAYTDANGNTQFATLNNTFSPVAGQAGVEVFNAAAGSGDVVINGNTVPLGSGAGVAFGTGGGFFSTPTGNQTITFNNGPGTPTIGTGGVMNFTAGQNTTVVLGPAAPGSAGLLAFAVPAC